MNSLNPYNKKRIDWEDKGSIWPAFIDLLAAALLLTVFMLVYQFFAKAMKPELLSLKENQKNFFGHFADEFQYEMRGGMVRTKTDGHTQTLSFGNEVLFDLGSDTLNNEGKEVLARCLTVFESLNQQQMRLRQIQVQGHTDSLPIHAGEDSYLASKGIFDNWDLSAARANNVIRFFNDRTNLDPSMFSSSAHSWHKWEGDHIEPISKNRKVEIVLVYANN